MFQSTGARVMIDNYPEGTTSYISILNETTSMTRVPVYQYDWSLRETGKSCVISLNNEDKNTWQREILTPLNSTFI